jgi:subtilisin family serine protease
VLIQTIPQFFANEVTVLIAGSQPDGVDDALAQSFGLTKLSSVPISLLDGRLVRYAIPGDRQLPQIIAALTADPRVNLAQPNNIYLTVGKKKRASKTPAQYSLAKLALTPAHKISQGRGVQVAVIDTGVDTSHPALANAVSQSFDAVGKGEPKVQQHGTAIAGLIAGKGKVKGVAPLSNVLAVRAFYMHPTYKRPVTSSAILLRALDWAFTNKARVFNLSFSGPFDPLVKAALTSAHDKGIILVAAAGNGGPKAAPAYPAAYENVIAITALDHKDKLYAHANRGNYLTAAAPGVDILVPSLKKGYRYSSGTSLAAAHISGLVALLLERYPDASTGDIVEAIRNSAHDLGPKGHDVLFGAGRADAHASLLSMTSSEVKLTSGQ